MALIVDGPRWWAQAAPDKPAFVFEGDAVAYRELDAWSDRIAERLVATGVAPGARVGQLAGNSLEYCVATVAILKAGGVVVPMSTRLTVSEIVTLTDSSEPRLVFTDTDTEEKAGAASERGCGFVRLDMAEVTAARLDSPPTTNGSAAVTVSRSRFQLADVDPDEPAALIYTSGTTGRPKGVIFTNRTILGFIAEWGLTEDGFNHEMRLLMPLPLGGAPGTIWGILHTVVRGATLYLQRQFRPQEALRSLVEDRITCMVGVPILYEGIAAQPEFTDADLSAWTTAHVGGARVSDEMLRTYGRKGVLVRQIYGLTEAGGSATANAKADALARPERCGRGNMFTTIRVVREDRTDCDPGETGEIILKGPAITPGYWGNAQATAETIRDGWLHSGDVGTLDETGNLRMVDRLKDLIISGGLNISPTEIENVVDELAEVAEVAVIPAEDPKFGETPAAIVRLDGALEVEQIIAHCDERLADFKVPRYVVVVDEPLPRMASGKLNKREIRSQYPDIADAYAKVR